jgi:hypothetical protein
MSLSSLSLFGDTNGSELGGVKGLCLKDSHRRIVESLVRNKMCLCELGVFADTVDLDCYHFRVTRNGNRFQKQLRNRFFFPPPISPSAIKISSTTEVATEYRNLSISKVFVYFCFQPNPGKHQTDILHLGVLLCVPDEIVR